MSVTQFLAPMLSSKKGPASFAANADPGEKGVWVSKETLTFPVVSGVLGVILTFLDSTPSKLLAGLLGLVVGGALVALSILKTPKQTRDAEGNAFWLESSVVGLLNVGMLSAAIYGAAAVVS